MTNRTTGPSMPGLAACAFALLLSGSAFAQESVAASAAAAPSAAASVGESGQHSCRPEYPPAAVRARAEGTTILEFTVAATGALTTVEILQSAGPTPEHHLLDEAAVAALRSCPFKAAVDGVGKPVEAKVKVNYDWFLDAAAAAAARKRRQ